MNNGTLHQFLGYELNKTYVFKNIFLIYFEYNFIY
jgi:hypothetical protein